MNKVNTNISLNPQLKKDAVALFANFGLDLSTAVTLFLSQAVREQKIPFEIRMESPSVDTKAAFDEYPEMRENTKKYKRYDSFEEALEDVLDA